MMYTWKKLKFSLIMISLIIGMMNLNSVLANSNADHSFAEEKEFDKIDSVATPTNILTTKIIRASPNSEIEFDMIALSVIGGSLKLEMSNLLPIDGSYRITFDAEKMEYTAIKIFEEKTSAKDLSVKMEPVKTPDVVICGGMSSSSLNNNRDNAIAPDCGGGGPPALQTKTASVHIKTFDPILLILAETHHQITWEYDGSRVYKKSYETSCQPWSNPPFSTWYNSLCEHSNYVYLDSSRTLSSKLTAEYYNYDFWDHNLYTYADHESYLEGNRNGGAYYTWDVNHSGEFSFLLSAIIEFRVY